MNNSYLDRIHRYKGSPYEIGYSAGRLFGKGYEQVIDRYISEQPIQKDIEKLHSEVMPWFHRLPRRFQEEYEGFAEGSNIPLQRIVEFSFIEECDIKGCSGAVLLLDNKVWVARNNDSFVPNLWGYATIREVNGRIPTITFSMEGDIFAPTGINKEKLWLHYNFLSVWDEPAANKPHFPGYVFLTEALELCSNISDVERMLNEIDRDGGMMLFAVDGKNHEFAIFECLCSKYFKREHYRSWIVGTNHFCACQDPTITESDKEPLGTVNRLNRMEDLVRALSTSHTLPNIPSDLIQILADDQIERRELQLMTVYSNVVCPSTGEIWYTFGGYPAASKGNWQRLEWPWVD
jgi:hypothetical protein